MKGSKKVPNEEAEAARNGKDRNVGDALRAVYRDAAAETIPDEMLDLLSKLK